MYLIKSIVGGLSDEQSWVSRRTTNFVILMLCANSEISPQEMRSRHGPTFPFATMDAIEWRFALKEAWVIDATTGDHFYPPDTVGRWVGGLAGNIGLEFSLHF